MNSPSACTGTSVPICTVTHFKDGTLMLPTFLVVTYLLPVSCSLLTAHIATLPAHPGLSMSHVFCLFSLRARVMMTNQEIFIGRHLIRAAVLYLKLANEFCYQRSCPHEGSMELVHVGTAGLWTRHLVLPQMFLLEFTVRQNEFCSHQHKRQQSAETLGTSWRGADVSAEPDGNSLDQTDLSLHRLVNNVLKAHLILGLVWLFETFIYKGLVFFIWIQYINLGKKNCRSVWQN